MVLLKNDGEVLPLKCGAKIALYGAGAVQTIKSGQGSGDVNSRKTVSIWEGLKNAGYDIVTEDWLHEFEQTYFDARLAWKKILWEKADEANAGDGFTFYDTTASTVFMPQTALICVPRSRETNGDTQD
ncbi:MAG: glycoside hydrolase family 3 C-terminal domain-containing protein [Ruminococcus sp.]